MLMSDLPMNQTEEKASSTEVELCWVDVCSLDDITPQTGVAAMLDGEQIALIRPEAADRVYALSNFDPFSKAFVISRGIIGDRAGVPKIASPIYKQNFSLETGECLDDPSVALRTYPVRIVGGRVRVGLIRQEGLQ